MRRHVEDVSPGRRRMMRTIRSKDAKPELAVRSLLHRMGYRFSRHRQDLPGKPAIVLPRHRRVTDVRGCFWHSHDCPGGSGIPKTNAEYRANKRGATRRRDQETAAGNTATPRSCGTIRRCGWPPATGRARLRWARPGACPRSRRCRGGWLRGRRRRASRCCARGCSGWRGGG